MNKITTNYTLYGNISKTQNLTYWAIYLSVKTLRRGAYSQLEFENSQKQVGYINI